jgi:hypothetical protein
MSGSIYQHKHILETPVIELVGVDEALGQDNYSASVEVPIEANLLASGEIMSITLIQTVVSPGTGSLLQPEGKLIIFGGEVTILADADALAVGGGDHRKVVGFQNFAAGNYLPGNNGHVAFVETAIPFPAVKSLWLSFFLTSATGLNDGEDDDELLECILRYRRDI